MQNLTTINENVFVGMNDKVPGHMLPKGVFQLLQNVLVGDDRLAKRPGSTGSTAIAGSQVTLGGLAFEPNGGTKVQVVCYDGATNAQLYKSTDGATFTSIGSANITKATQMNFVQASNSLFGFNGAEVMDFDGTTVTKNRSGVPIGKFGSWFHNYLFVAGVSGNPNRLYWSNLGDPLTFSGSNFIDINANDGDSITGLGQFNDALIVFKNNSLWKIDGWSGSTFSTTTIAGQNTTSILSGLGTPSHQSIVAAGHYLYYLSFLGGTPHIRQLQRSLYGIIIDGGIVSLDIEGTMKGLNLTKLSLVAGIYDGKYIKWAVPSSSSSINDTAIVYYPELSTRGPLGIIRSWTKWTGINVNQWFLSTISGRTKVYFTDSGTTGKIFLVDSSVATDNGVAVVMTITTRDYIIDPEGPRKGKWKYVYTRYKAGSAGSILLNARLDEAAAYNLENTIATMGNSPGLGPTGTFTLGVSVLGGSTISTTRTTLAQMTGHLLGVQYTESTSNVCEIYDYQVLGFKRGLRAS